MYFGHGYKVIARANMKNNFADATENNNLTDWTEIYVSAWMSDICGDDPYTTGNKWCVGSKPEANGGGRCCTKLGKSMRVGAEVVEGVGAGAGEVGGGKTVYLAGGFSSQLAKTGPLSKVGRFFCHDQEFGVRRNRYGGYQNIDFTTKVYRDGAVECWLGHNVAKQGLPTGPPNKRVETGIALGPKLASAYVLKKAPWAEGGGVAKDVAVVVKSATTEWSVDKTCEMPSAPIPAAAVSVARSAHAQGGGKQRGRTKRGRGPKKKKRRNRSSSG